LVATIATLLFVPVVFTLVHKHRRPTRDGDDEDAEGDRDITTPDGSAPARAR